MATIIGGIGVSHTPTIGFAYDTNKQNDPVCAQIFESFEPIRAWFKEKRPDALVYIFNDRVTSFFFDHYSAFALGIDKQYFVADEGGGSRALPPAPSNPQLAQHVAVLVLRNFSNLSLEQSLALSNRARANNVSLDRFEQEQSDFFEQVRV